MTMVTVGYGDVTPKNNIEMLFANLAMFFTCGLFGYTVSSINNIMANLSAKSAQY